MFCALEAEARAAAATTIYMYRRHSERLALFASAPRALSERKEKRCKHVGLRPEVTRETNYCATLFLIEETEQCTHAAGRRVIFVDSASRLRILH